MLTFDLVVIDLVFNIVRLIFIVRLADSGSAAHNQGCGVWAAHNSEQEQDRDEPPELCPTTRTITTLLVVDSNHLAMWASSLSLGSAARRQRATQDVSREDHVPSFGGRWFGGGSFGGGSFGGRSIGGTSFGGSPSSCTPCMGLDGWTSTPSQAVTCGF